MSITQKDKINIIEGEIRLVEVQMFQLKLRFKTRQYLGDEKGMKDLEEDTETLMKALEFLGTQLELEKGKDDEANSDTE